MVLVVILSLYLHTVVLVDHLFTLFYFVQPTNTTLITGVVQRDGVDGADAGSDLSDEREDGQEVRNQVREGDRCCTDSRLIPSSTYEFVCDTPEDVLLP